MCCELGLIKVRLHFAAGYTTGCVDTTGCTTIYTTGFITALVNLGKCSPYSITERRVPELIPVLGSQPAGDVCHKPGGRLPLLFSRPAVTLATLMAATSFAAW